MRFTKDIYIIGSWLRILPDLSLRQIYYRLRHRLLHRGRLHAFDDHHPCVFVLSTGRVGTKTLAAILSLCSNIFAYHEPRPKLFALSRLAYLYNYHPPTDEILTAAFLVARQDLLEYSLSCRRGYVETSPQITFLAPAVLHAIPNVRFIHLARHPVAVVRSGMRRGWYADHPYDSTRITPRPGTKDAEYWETYSVVQKNLWLWAETNRWIIEFMDTLPTHQRFRLKAEDLFTGRPEVLHQLFAFVGCSMPSPSKIHAILRKKLNAQRKGSLSDEEWNEIWNNVFQFTNEVASRLGYTISLDR